jgi:Tfp pilus assembly major pilin PilA
MRLLKSKKEKGFTLVEAMVATTVFVVVITIGITAVLNVNVVHKKTQSMRSVIDSLSFIMEDMSRYLKLGNVTHCGEDNFSFTAGNIETAVDGEGSECMAISTEPFTNPILEGSEPPYDQVVYWITEDDDGVGTILKAPTGTSHSIPDSDWFVLTPPEVDIDLLRSGFTVVGAEQSGDGIQPRISIRLAGTVTYRDVVTNFNLQTTVSQRYLDL